MTAVLAGFLGATVWALQPDAGAKIRGDYGPGFRRPSSAARTGSGARMAETREYRTYSVEPIGILPGATVVVGKESAPVMLGRQVLGTLPKGTQFKVLKITNGWLGAVIDVDGKTLNGWVWHKDVVVPESAAAPAQP